MSQLLLVASIGALSMDKGAGVVDLEKYSFPADFVFESLAAFNLSLAEIKAFLRSGEKKTVRVQCRDDMVRTVNSISQIAFLNKSDALLNIYAHADAGDAFDTELAGADAPELAVDAPELTVDAELTTKEEQVDDVDAPSHEDSEAQAESAEESEAQTEDLEEVSTDSAKSPAKTSAKAKKNSKKEDK